MDKACRQTDLLTSGLQPLLGPRAGPALSEPPLPQDTTRRPHAQGRGEGCCRKSLAFYKPEARGHSLIQIRSFFRLLSPLLMYSSPPPTYSRANFHKSYTHSLIHSFRHRFSLTRTPMSLPTDPLPYAPIYSGIHCSHSFIHGLIRGDQRSWDVLSADSREAGAARRLRPLRGPLRPRSAPPPPAPAAAPPRPGKRALSGRLCSAAGFGAEPSAWRPPGPPRPSAAAHARRALGARPSPELR